ncbi:MAG TPA: ABC transporter permease [Acidobacteriaceae bacterium]
MLADAKQALRQLRKSPGFTVTVVVTLALGIGATAAIFTLVEQVMLRSLPVTRPEQLWRIGDEVRCCNWGGYMQGDDKYPNDFALFSWEAYQQFRANTPAFEQLAAIQAGNAPLGVRRAGTNEQAQTRNGEYVSGNFFSTFGIHPWIGRTLTDADDVEGAPAVAVMSYRVWQQKYGGDPSVVGAVYQINGHSFTVVGVTPPGFYGAKFAGWGMPDFWLPATTEPMIDGATARLKSPSTCWFDLIGRVKPGTNPKALEAQLRTELHSWLASHVSDMGPQEKQEWQKETLNLTPGGAGVADMRASYGQGLRLLLVAAACVLLVACANIANLLLARGLKNRQQTAVRVALGASRRRLVRKALVESVLLGLIGGALGVGLAYAGARLILHLAFQPGPNTFVPVEATPSTVVLLFTLGISVLTGMIFGIAPAWMTSHAEPVEALRGANRSVGGRSTWPQKSLVIAQAAVSLVLLSAAALLGESLRNLEHQNFGFVAQDRYIVWINPLLGNYKPEQLDTLFKQIDDRLQAIPGVRLAAPALYAPMTGDNWNNSIRVEGKPEPAPKDNDSSGFTRVMPGFFEAMGDSVVQGRALTEEDTATTRPVAVVNQAFVKRFFKKGENPIGQHFGPNRMKYAGMYEIVGVAADMRFQGWGYADPIEPIFMLPEAQTTRFDEANMQSGETWSHYLYNIVLWAPGHPSNLEQQVKRALGDVDPNLVNYGVDSYETVLKNNFTQQNMIANLVLLFGAIGLLLAAIGLYGVTAYSVEQRTSEIGVRMALGADRGRVIGMVLKSAFLQVGIGLALGIPSAIGAGYLIASQLFGVKPWDAVMLAMATLTLGLAALFAAIIPARRAAALDPVVALRTE